MLDPQAPYTPRNLLHQFVGIEAGVEGLEGDLAAGEIRQHQIRPREAYVNRYHVPIARPNIELRRPTSARRVGRFPFEDRSVREELVDE
jgi:hypothetical protein